MSDGDTAVRRGLENKRLAKSASHILRAPYKTLNVSRGHASQGALLRIPGLCTLHRGPWNGTNLQTHHPPSLPLAVASQKLSPSRVRAGRESAVPFVETGVDTHRDMPPPGRAAQLEPSNTVSQVSQLTAQGVYVSQCCEKKSSNALTPQKSTALCKTP